MGLVERDQENERGGELRIDSLRFPKGDCGPPLENPPGEGNETEWPLGGNLLRRLP